MSERAVSDALGFVFVFAIVVATVGLVFTAGFSGLQDARDFERVNNAERAFEVHKDNVEDMVFRGAPSRATEIKLADARLSFGDPVTVNVSAAGGSFNTSQQLDPLVYDAGTGARIVYAAGAILRNESTGGIVTRPAGLVLSENRTAVTIVQTRAEGSGGVGGDGTVLVRSSVAQRAILYTNEGGEVTLWLNLTTPRAGAWRASLSDRPGVTCQPVAGQEVACQVTTKRAHVTLVSIDTELT